MAHARRDSLQHRQVEVDRVPAGQHVGVERADARAERVERRVLVGAAHRVLRHRPRSRRRRSALRRARRVQRDREQALRPFGSVSMSNDSTRGSSSTRAGRSVGLSKIHVTPLAARRLAFDLAAAFDAALDQVARRRSARRPRTYRCRRRAADRAAAARRTAPRPRCARRVRRRRSCGRSVRLRRRRRARGRARASAARM